MSKYTVAIIQARMGSTRLPGKIMLPLRDRHVLTHVIQRITNADSVDDVIVATSTETQDDIIARYADRADAIVHRGSESDVLQRLFNAAKDSVADIVVRITGDCPLVDPATIDTVIKEVVHNDVDYSTNIIKRTFPRGLDVEAFTFESFNRVHEEATEPHHREHVTPYYRENPNQFELVDVTSGDVFNDPQFQNRDDLRLTLDEANDYEVLREIYENISFDDILPTREAIRYADENNLMSLNAAVEQKTH